MLFSPEVTAETPNTVHHIPTVGRPFGTFTNRRLFPALKRRICLARAGVAGGVRPSSGAATCVGEACEYFGHPRVRLLLRPGTGAPRHAKRVRNAGLLSRCPSGTKNSQPEIQTPTLPQAGIAPRLWRLEVLLAPRAKAEELKPMGDRLKPIPAGDALLQFQRKTILDLHNLRATPAHQMMMMPVVALLE